VNRPTFFKVTALYIAVVVFQTTSLKNQRCLWNQYRCANKPIAAIQPDKSTYMSIKHVFSKSTLLSHYAHFKRHVAIHRHFCRWTIAPCGIVSAVLWQSLSAVRQLGRIFDDGKLSAKSTPRRPQSLSFSITLSRTDTGFNDDPVLNPRLFWTSRLRFFIVIHHRRLFRESLDCLILVTNEIPGKPTTNTPCPLRLQTLMDAGEPLVVGVDSSSTLPGWW